MKKVQLKHKKIITIILNVFHQLRIKAIKLKRQFPKAMTEIKRDHQQ